MARGDRERWDARYAEGGALAPEAVAWLDILAGALPRSGRALDVAAGRGRVALRLAQRGLSTTAVDVSPRGLALAEAAAHAAGLPLETFALDLESEPLPDGPFDVITCFNYLQWELMDAMAERLAPSGHLVVEHPTLTNLERNARPSRRFLVEPGRLREAARGLEVARYEEGWFEGRHVARLWARKPSLDT